MDDDVKIYKFMLVVKGYKQRQIDWLWWNLLVGNYVKIHKDFICYSYISWL
jgi:hypothetical protein